MPGLDEQPTSAMSNPRAACGPV